MRRLILAAVVALIGATACEPAINPPPIPPPITAIFKEIFHSTVPDPTGVHAPREPHSCAIRVYPAGPSLYANYDTIDPYWRANGWAFWSACVIAARDVGFAIPVVKANGMPNETVMRPFFHYKLVTAPVFGTGSGIYQELGADNVSVWTRAYIEASS